MRTLHPILLVLLAPGLMASGCNEGKLNVRMMSETFEQAPSNEVDILWVVDNSISMVQEQQAVAAGGQAFIDQLDETGMDFHLGVITSDLDSTNTNAGVLVNGYVTNATPNYVQQFATNIQVGTGGSDQEKGMGAAERALTAPLTDTRNVGFLRDDASLAIIVLSDENDCTDDGALGADSTGEDCYTNYDKLVPIPDIVTELKALKQDSDGNLTFSGIIGPDAVDGCEDAVPGKRYATAIQMIGGVRANICQADFGTIMDSLGLIATGILESFPLSNLAKEGTITVDVNDVDDNPILVVEDATNGWTYEEAEDKTYASIVFHGTAVPPRGAMISVEYAFGGNLNEADTGS